jgi:hypothetical protein
MLEKQADHLAYRQHMNNLKQGLKEKSKLAKYAYEEGYHIPGKEAKAVQI